MSYEIDLYGGFEIKPQLSDNELHQLTEFIKEFDDCVWVPKADCLEHVGTVRVDVDECVNMLRSIAARIMALGHELNGECRWQGEDYIDCGVIYARGNNVEAVCDSNMGPSWDRWERKQ